MIAHPYVIVFLACAAFWLVMIRLAVLAFGWMT